MATKVIITEESKKWKGYWYLTWGFTGEATHCCFLDLEGYITWLVDVLLREVWSAGAGASRAGSTKRTCRIILQLSSETEVVLT